MFLNFGNITGVPYLAEYFGLWAMREYDFMSQLSALRQFNLSAHMASEASDDAKARANTPYTVVDGVALIDVTGNLMKQASSFGQGTSTVMVRHQLREALNDDAVNSIMMRIDSPGGTVAGTQELAAEIANVKNTKAVIAYIEDLGASAAYWIASQATSIWANATALVGSIGTYGVVNDASGMAAKEGVKVHVVRAGPFKGMGVPGTEITSDHLQEMQRTVDGLNAFFLNDVATGRGYGADQLEKLADGRVHIASEALTLRLIDTVGTMDAAFAFAKEKATQGPSRLGARSQSPPEANMPNEVTKVAATVAEIKATCKGATAEFIVKMIEKSATIADCQTAWMDEQHAQIVRLQSATKLKPVKAADEKPDDEKEEAAADPPDEEEEEDEEEEKATARAKPKAKLAKRVGAKPIEATGSGAPKLTATEQWRSMLAEKMKAGMNIERSANAIESEFPTLRQEMIDEANEYRAAILRR